MLPLDSLRWAELQHAYGKASDVPGLLRQLASQSRSEAYGDTWFALWSALAHQGDVYSASFAAVPHIVALLADSPVGAGSAYFHFPAWVEICRRGKQVEIPVDLEADYFYAIARLPLLAAAASSAAWDNELCRCALAAIATSKGHISLAEAILELDVDVAEEFKEWFYSR